MCSSGGEIKAQWGIIQRDSAQSGTVSTAVLLDKYASKEEVLLTGCRPCGYILKCILCLSLQCKSPLAEWVECAHGHTSLSKGGEEGGGGGTREVEGKKYPALKNDAVAY